MKNERGEIALSIIAVTLVVAFIAQMFMARKADREDALIHHDFAQQTHSESK